MNNREELSVEDEEQKGEQGDKTCTEGHCAKLSFSFVDHGCILL